MVFHFEECKRLPKVIYINVVQIKMNYTRIYPSRCISYDEIYDERMNYTLARNFSLLTVARRIVLVEILIFSIV